MNEFNDRVAATLEVQALQCFIIAGLIIANAVLIGDFALAFMGA